MDIYIHIPDKQEEKQKEFPSIRLDYEIPPAYRNCPNHPKNGGSGVCHCTLGSPQITC